MRLSSGFLPALLLFIYSPALLARTPDPPAVPSPMAALTRDSLPPAPAKARQKIEAPYLKNRLKINVSSFFLNNYSFSYERSLTRKISFVAGYRFMPRSVLGNISLIKKIVDQVAKDGDGIKNDINKLSLSSNAYTGEFRFYTGHKPGPRGFYFSLYGRYSQLNIDYAYEYATGSKTYSIPIKASTKMWGAGLMIGAQWLIARRITLDWHILGGHYGSVSGDASGLADLSAMSPSDKEAVKEDIEGLINIGDKKFITATVTNQGVQAKIDGPMVGLRGAGINIGIAF
ncbi:MAG: hypothetical protein J0H74_35435 [Chitinophagaceae bacterium]|nr:hypothetical protein [Chitinophagaceae bacterium]